MLKVFRDNLKYLSWVLWLVIAVFVLFVFVDFGSTVPGPAPPSEAAASVAGDEISYGELQRAYRRAEETYRQAYGGQFTPELARQLQLPLQVLEQLVQERILIGEADRIGLAVTDSELQNEILRVPIFLSPDGTFVGAEEYRRIVRNLGYQSPEELEAELRSQILVAKLNRVLADNIVVADTEVETAFRETAEQAKIRYVKVPISRFRDDATLTTDEVETYFLENIEAFRLPERRAVDYLLVDPDTIRHGLDISDEELRAYFRANSAEYETEEQVRARQILLQPSSERGEEETRQELEALRARIEAGEDFAALAAEHSEDPVTASQGGDLGFFGRGQILQEVETAAFEAQPGDLIGPVKSAFAYHLVEVLEHTPGGLPQFEEMREALRRRVLSERAREAAEARTTELADRISREGLTDTASWEQLAEGDDAISLRSTQLFGATDNVAGIGRSTPFSATAFQLESDGVSSPVRVGSGWAIVRLRETEEPRLPELAEADSDVRARLRDTKSEAAALESLTNASQRVAAGTSLDDVAEGFEGTVEESSQFSAAGTLGGSLGANPQLASAALALEPGDVGEPLVLGPEIVLFQVSDRIHFDPVEFEEHKEETRGRLVGERLNTLLTTLIQERREELEITYDPQISENLGLAG